MKVLLDENLDHALRKLLGQHEVVTVTYMGWAGLQNGALFTCSGRQRDRSSSHRRPIAQLRTEPYREALAIVALSAIQLPIIKEDLPQIVTAIDNAAPGSF